MLQIRASWLLRLAAVAGVVIIGQPASAVQSTAPVDMTSFSGAYLAARVAEVDNDLDGAIEYYQKALIFDPENEQLQQSVMLALITNGRFQEALPYAEKLKKVPDVERFSRLALAVDAFRKKDFKGAEPLLKLVSSSDLDTLITESLTAWAKLGAGDKKGAIEKLDKLDGPDWYTLFVSYQKALIAEQAGMNDVADAAYQATIDDVAAGSAAPETWMRAAEAYAGFLARSGKKDAALAVLDKADEFAAGRLPITFVRAKIKKGETIAPMVANPADGGSELLLALASALNRGGGESFVRLYLQYALALKPDSDVVLVQLASVSEQQQDAEGAIAFYRRIPAASSLKRMSELQTGLNLADLDKHDEAIKQLKPLVDQDPSDMRAYLALGGVYASKEDYRGAADVYDRAVAQIEAKKVNLPKDPSSAANWNIYYQRGIAYERLKEWPKAEPNFRRALELFPDQPQVLNYLGYSWIDMNMNLKEGMDMISKAVELRPSDGYIVDSLGWAHYRLGQYDDAVRELERAVSLKPEDPVLNDHLGDAYWRAGRKLEATFQWSHARDMKPDPDILAGVVKKLAEGLPPIENKALAENTVKTDAPAVETPAPAPIAMTAPATPKPEQVKEAAAPKPDEIKQPAPAVSEAAAEKPVPASYKVQRGESLWSIAAEKLGDGKRYIEIIGLNPKLRSHPGLVVPGQELLLPK